MVIKHRYKTSVAVCLLLLSLNLRAAVFDCLIEPNQSVDILSPVVGLLEKIYVKRGDRVAKGQVLATLDSKAEQFATELALYRANLTGPTLAAESKIEFSKKKFNRRRDLAADKHIAVQERDEAEAEYRQAEAELQIAKENRQIAKFEYQQQNSQLALRTLRSPFDGVVVDQQVYPGEVVEPNGAGKKVIFRLAQLDPLRVHIILPMSMFGRLEIGSLVNLVPEIPTQSTYQAKVKSIDRIIDAASGTFSVLLELPNHKLTIPAGVKCRATLSTSEIKSSSPKPLKSPIS